MPFEIVRNDIVNMQVDAIVNTASPNPVIGYGVDAGVNKKAGPALLEARKRIGRIELGSAAVTPAFDLHARYVIHAVSPVWQDGKHGEAQNLRRCYDCALKLAWEHHCESVAFPLLSAGNHGFPKKDALRIAVNAFSDFLLDHEMQIYLVVFSKEAVQLSEQLVRGVANYIDETYVLGARLDEYGVADKRDVREAELRLYRTELDRKMRLRKEQALRDMKRLAVSDVPAAASVCGQNELEQLLKKADAGFSETLLKLIDRTGKKDAEIYKKANVDRKLFSKIRNNPGYRPAKATALAFALALELDLEETRDFIGRAGYALSHASYFDIIVEYFIKTGNYNVFELNEVLFAFDQPLIGA